MPYTLQAVSALITSEGKLQGRTVLLLYTSISFAGCGACP